MKEGYKRMGGLQVPAEIVDEVREGLYTTIHMEDVVDLSPEDLKTLQDKIVESEDWSYKGRCPSLLKMGKFIQQTFDVKVTLSTTSQRKYTKAAGMRYTTGGGIREYTGYVLRCDSLGIHHDSTETYRANRDVAWDIVKELKKRGRL